MYGKGDETISVSVSTINDFKAAHLYMKQHEMLELKDGRWIRDVVAEDYKMYKLGNNPWPDFDEVMASLPGDREIQKLLRELDSQVLVRALMGSKSKELVYRNMSKRACSMMKEDEEFMGEIPKDKIERDRTHIIDVIRHLVDCEEIELKDPSLLM